MTCLKAEPNLYGNCLRVSIKHLAPRIDLSNSLADLESSWCCTAENLMSFKGENNGSTITKPEFKILNCNLVQVIKA